MQLKVDAVTKQPRSFNNRTSWGVKDANGTWYSLYVDDKPSKGNIFNVEVKESTGKDGRKFYDAFLIAEQQHPPQQPPPPKQANPEKSNGWPAAQTAPKAPVPAMPAVPTWGQYAAMIRAAHALAVELEPDKPELGYGSAPARAAIVNTISIAFSNGKVIPPTADDGIPGSDAPLPDDSYTPAF